MDKASVIGIGVGIGALLLGNALEGGHVSALLQPTAAIIVVGGTLGATLVSFPLTTFLEACRAFKLVFKGGKKDDTSALIKEITTLAMKARRDGILSLEDQLPSVQHPFLRRALIMAVDGLDSKAMRDNLEGMLDRIDEDGERSAKVWEAAGGYAPTIGIIGAVMGLIHVMQNLTDVGAVGKGIAVAFVSTIYGVGLANLVFLPAATKLKLLNKAEIAKLELMMEGALGIQEGQNPNLIAEKLSNLGRPETNDEQEPTEPTKEGVPAEAG
ncbi:MAG: flagellar motor protein [Pseudomonadota bacterium]